MELRQTCVVQAVYIINGYITLERRAPKVTRWCAKKDKAIINGRNKCSYYVMDEFFQKRGYKVIKG